MNNTNNASLRPIPEIAERMGLPQYSLTPYGRLMAKVALDAIKPSSDHKAKLVLVTSINPTPHGEGKTVTSIGLSMALNKIGHRATVCTRQPSIGPLFGVKGGAAGGGNSRLEPMQEINMRLTGDIDAIGSAHNLLAAMLDNHIYQGNESPKIDSAMITWSRTVDMNDRSLRRIEIGVGEKREGVHRVDSYVITAASEVMTTLCLSKGYSDLKERLGRIIVAYSDGDNPVRARDLRAQGAMAAILRDALQPNLVQTCEGTPALVHGGPFGNIATGTSSLVSIRFGLSFSEYCVVEAGFGSDLGAEKFFDIVSRIGGFGVDAVVIVASIRALKYHGTLEGVSQEERLKKGLENLEKHVENMRTFGATPVVAINKFPDDAEEEVKELSRFCTDLGLPFSVSEVFAKGGEGAVELAYRVVEACKTSMTVKRLYGLEESVEEKIWKVSTMVYGAGSVEYTSKARGDLDRISKIGLSNLPVCIAKTPFSLSDDPKKLGRPKDFTVKVTAVDAAAGPGFNVVKMGDILMMPGLPKHPAAESFDLLDDGRITGIF